MSTAVVRTPDGTVLGPDWRRVFGAVPGAVAAEHVEPGDRVAFGGQLVTVLSRAPQGPASVSIVVRTPSGGEVVLERYTGDRVEVLEVGAFDPPADALALIAQSPLVPVEEARRHLGLMARSDV